MLLSVSLTQQLSPSLQEEKERSPLEREILDQTKVNSCSVGSSDSASEPKSKAVRLYHRPHLPEDEGAEEEICF